MHYFEVLQILSKPAIQAVFLNKILISMISVYSYDIFNTDI